MRTFFLSVAAGLASLSLYGCGGDDLVLPTDGDSPGTGGGTTTSTPDASLSTLSADPASIQVGSDTATIRVTVRDESGAPMPGVTVTLAAAGSGNRVQQPATPTNADGVAMGRISSDVAGTKEVSALVNGTVRLNQTAQVFVTPGSSPPPPPPPSAAEPDHFEFRVQPHDVGREERFSVEVAILDASGNVVPLNGTEIYLGLWEEGDDHPSNSHLLGDRFEETRNGIATFDLGVKEHGRYRFMARSDHLPKRLGPYGPELFSNWFQVF